ncbi:MAG: hypothetical protein A3A83_00350 [Candidatus Doudnabacteria bacterium RIFCSPLOWO2_01_FULL_48_57]|uniref:Uncharacterized protein n=1 Tax=Candidatus Doudnabacteria bacterium RIFCSPLOWO2_02_FULL_48_13 TaxID=1817845 RepID=A0A1F5QDA3_9BACT|nr:MAG: hypothetical protein A3K05_00055 [Candidatus Doudnabacteria bacterium RIFCSPHIGHO2_01_48_18]OGE91830.1 MAG: hypothetical protein A3F44_00540 [Candidatus Doudnabacteria bacterium RIFCSPHIGHO2_12_FULL_47_25]OGE97898.1 MAG: hypothetical protein A3A83_00350 [Candidatus Doudnabacteria bacterium RIFCSPLOWO2_01_FULL_48_57]OGF00129.1 MAG: hypothetical protein A3J05_03460 [Candidatus Doudnabacteria bacterium RIFCSPLOWO2_02_FULL_48_13]
MAAAATRLFSRAEFKLTKIMLAKSPITEITTRSSINVNPAPLFTDLIFLIVFIWSGNFTILNIYIMENWCWIKPNHFGKLKVVLKSVERRAGSRGESKTCF